ncbi:hypothetical protein PCC7418_0242 [Halothece sp. PCC 7418]|nr:hypothetical protein PCC7418_0242 [Halothece sp. PCC 7418]
MIPLFWANLATVVWAQSLAKTSCEIAPSENGTRAGFQIRNQEEGDKEIVRATNPSQTEISSPSLWWAVEKYDPLDGKLVTDWEANPGTKMIHLVVNNRFWQTLDYLDQYSLINQFGTVAREYNYNLSLVSQQEDCLATYTCNLQGTSPNCKIKFNTF